MTAVTAVSLLAACNTSSQLRSGEGVTVVNPASLPSPDRSRLLSEEQPAYYIGPLDVLEISVFQAPDLTRTAQVDAGGSIMLPLIGAVKVAGQTSEQAAASIARSLGERYLQNPQVSVFVKEAQSSKVTVEGSVMQPGVYPLTGRTTLLQALALARGPDRVADQKRVAVFRTIEGQRMAAVFDLTAIRSGQAKDPEVYGNDLIVVDVSGSKSVLRDVVGTAPIFAVFRPLF